MQTESTYHGIYRVWLTSNVERSRAAPWCNSTLVVVVVEVRDTSTVVVHVCGDGCGGDYENGSGNLVESQADGDVTLTARWNINGKKMVRGIDTGILARLFFSHRVATEYRWGPTNGRSCSKMSTVGNTRRKIRAKVADIIEES